MWSKTHWKNKYCGCLKVKHPKFIPMLTGIVIIVIMVIIVIIVIIVIMVIIVIIVIIVIMQALLFKDVKHIYKGWEVYVFEIFPEKGESLEFTWPKQHSKLALAVGISMFFSFYLPQQKNVKATEFLGFLKTLFQK